MVALGLPFVRSMYLDPYTYSSNIFGPRLGTAVKNYTETEWKSYWNTTLDRLQQEHVDAVYFMVGLRYIKAARTNDSSMDSRINWNMLEWTINKTHEIIVDPITGRKMKFLFWVNLNKDNPYDFTPLMGSTSIVKLRTTPNAGSSTYPEPDLYRQDYAYQEVRNRHITEIKWAVQNYDFDGIQYEEPVLNFSRNPSYSMPVIDRYIQLHGHNPLSVYENDTVRLRMYEIHEEFLTQCVSELKNVIVDVTSKRFPEFVIGANSIGWLESSMYWNNGVNWTDWGNKGLIDYYIAQFSGKPVDFYDNGIAGLLDSCPNISCGASVHLNFSYDRELLVRDEIMRQMNLGCAQQGGIFDFHYIDVIVNGISWHDFLVQNLPPPPTYDSPPIDAPDLIREWRFDEGSGIIAYDSSEYGIHGNIIGNPIWVDGIFGSALNFNGINQYVDCGTDYLPNTTDAITIMAWIKPNVAGEGGPNAGVISKAEYLVPDWSWQARYNAPDGYFGFQFNGTLEGKTWVSVRDDLIAGQWYRIVGMFDGTYIRCYLNGVERDINQISGIKSSNCTLFIGQDGWGNNFNGTIDDVKIYNRGLSAEEIRVDYGDITPPIVIGYEPTGVNVPVTTQISVSFSEAMDQASTESSFSISPATPGSFSWSSDSTIMTFIPASDLAPDTIYVVTIGTGAMDVAGNYLQAPYSWEFTTEYLDVTSPIVIGYEPTGVNVPITTQISVTFSEPMNQPSAESSFLISPATSGSFSWNSDSTIMTFTPASDLAPDTTHMVTIGTGAMDVAGNYLQAPYSWMFITVYSDITPPYSYRYKPTGVNVPITTQISVTFSEAMNQPSAESSFSISPPTLGSFSWNSDSTIMTFTPASDLAPDTIHMVTIGTGAMDLAGNALQAPYSWDFTTSYLDITPPIVTGNAPTGVTVPVTTQISVVFSEDMNQASVESSFLISPATSGSFSWNSDSNIMTFTPASDLAPDTIHMVTIGTGAMDMAGNALQAPYSWQFTTSYLDITPPIVTGNAPTGVTVPVTTQISIAFSEDMNHPSTESSFLISPSTLGRFSWNGNIMTFTPASDLASNTVHMVTIGTGAMDLAGNALQSPYSWDFTTVDIPRGFDPWLLLLPMLPVAALVVTRQISKVR